MAQTLKIGYFEHWFRPPYAFVDFLAEQGIGVRAGLHCAPLAHESAGTLDTGTVRVSFGHDAAPWQTGMFIQEAEKLTRQS